MAHFLDEVPFDFSDPAAQSLVDFLATTYFRETDIVRFVLATGIDAAGIAWGRTAREEWLDAFLKGALEGKNRHFVEVIAGSGDKAVAARLAESLAAAPVAPPAAVPEPDWNAAPMTEELERQTAAEPTLLDVTFLERGTQLARGVVRLLVTMPSGKRYYGTGFLIAPDLLLTNHHVLFDQDHDDVRATRVEVWFGYERDFGGVLRPHVAIEAAPASIQGNKENDWAVVRVAAADVPQAAVVIDIGQLGSVGVDDRVYIIQHPNGGPKQIGMVHNVVRFVDEAVVQYLTDTEPGSSGSPVFDEEWRLVALHHQGRTVKVNGSTEIRNQGRQMTRVVAELSRAGLR